MFEKIKETNEVFKFLRGYVCMVCMVFQSNIKVKWQMPMSSTPHLYNISRCTVIMVVRFIVFWAIIQ